MFDLTLTFGEKIKFDTTNDVFTIGGQYNFISTLLRYAATGDLRMAMFDLTLTLWAKVKFDIIN